MQCPECFAEFEFSLKKYLHWKPSCDHCGVRWQRSWNIRDEITFGFFSTILFCLSLGFAAFGIKYQSWQNKGWMESSSLPFWYFFVAGSLITFAILLTHGFIKYRTVYTVYQGVGLLLKEYVKKLPAFFMGYILAIVASALILIGWGHNKNVSLTAFSGCPKADFLPENVSIGICKAGARYTLALGANPDHTEFFRKQSPLGLALLLKEHEMVNFLLDAGADVMQVYGKDSKSVPMAYAVQDTRYLDRFIKLAGGPDALLPPQNTNLLMEAIIQAKPPKFNREIILKLMDYGLDINKPTGHSEFIPFLVACYLLDARIVEELISRGGNVQIIDKGKVTPAHFAAQNKDPEVIRVLIRHGAPVNIISDNGKTPLLGAQEEGNEEVVKILEQHLGQK